MSVYERALKRLSTTAWFRWTLSKVATPLDMKFKGTRFAPSRFGVDLPLCFLTTTGARSGEPRTVPLLYVPRDGGAIAVAATNFGTAHHPGWAYNLEAEPASSLEIGDEALDVVARRATDSEMAELWPLFDGVWPGYESYRSIAPRDIKMFILEAEAE
ncbi:MAG: hypothetical protein BMS9Abin20_1514 [Acidimicrobiia bacterium]|nr:MAG: hypothetical protein BMS9Abin20_1514 [Acidimicrobiia bacterium]